MEENNVTNEKKENTPNISTSNTLPANTSGIMRKTFCTHTAKILGNLGFFTCIVGLLLFFSFLIPPLYFVLMLILTMGTAGMIFLIIPNFKDWWAYSSVLADNVEIFIPISKWILGASIMLSAVSLILMLINKDNRNSTRVTFCIITTIISTIALIVRLLNLLGV